MTTFAQFAELHGLTMTTTYQGRHFTGEPALHAPKGWEFDQWVCTIRQGKKSMRVTYKLGTGHAGNPPKLHDVLYALASDANEFCAPDVPAFEQWADNYGYDTDSRKAEKTYRACKRQSERLKTFLGSALLLDLVECEEE